MDWNTIQQLIRIIAYAVGSYFLGDAAANGEQFQAALGGIINLAAFGWWVYQERQKKVEGK